MGKSAQIRFPDPQLQGYRKEEEKDGSCLFAHKEKPRATAFTFSGFSGLRRIQTPP
jgi:hypothetical protein